MEPALPESVTTLTPVSEVGIDVLRPGDSPRLYGLDEQTVQMLARSDEPYRPIIVHQSTRRVIDGMHRLRAAQLRGDRTIAVRFYSGDLEDAFLLAVQANIGQGLPLSLADRVAAAARILIARPDWSDRRVARLAGLSDKTVAAVRTREWRVGRLPRTGRRLGLDGKFRALDMAERRAEAARLLAEQPESSLREIARQVGISPETVRSVRAGLTAREDRPPVRTASAPAVNGDTDPWFSLQALAADPAMRSTEPGRRLLRAVSASGLVRQRPELVESVPTYALTHFRTLALAISELWRQMADSALMYEQCPDQAERG